MLEKPFVDNTFGDFTKCGKNTNGSVIGKMFKRKGGGVEGFLDNVKKKLHFFTARLPLAESAKSESHRCYMYLRYRYFKFRNDPPPDHSISISSSSHMLY